MDWFNAAKNGLVDYIEEHKNDKSNGARSIDESFNNRTALHYAAQYNNYKIVEVLLPLEAKMQNSNGWTALMYAASNDAQESVRMLIDQEKTIQNNKQKTALILAIEKGHKEIIKMLYPFERSINCGEQDPTSFGTQEIGDYLAILEQQYLEEQQMFQQQEDLQMEGDAVSLAETKATLRVQTQLFDLKNQYDEQRRQLQQSQTQNQQLQVQLLTLNRERDIMQHALKILGEEYQDTLNDQDYRDTAYDGPQGMRIGSLEKQMLEMRQEMRELRNMVWQLVQSSKK